MTGHEAGPWVMRMGQIMDKTGSGATEERKDSEQKSERAAVNESRSVWKHRLKVHWMKRHRRGIRIKETIAISQCSYDSFGLVESGTVTSIPVSPTRSCQSSLSKNINSVSLKVPD